MQPKLIRVSKLYGMGGRGMARMYSSSHYKKKYIPRQEKQKRNYLFSDKFIISMYYLTFYHIYFKKNLTFFVYNTFCYLYIELKICFRKRKTEQLEWMECPICLETPRTGPIHSCRKGHIICKVGTYVTCQQRIFLI